METNRLYKNTSLSGKAGDVLETLTNITSKDQLACMCQGCLSSGPLKVWATISHSTLNVKCLTPDCWEVGFRPSEPAVPVFMFIFRLLILPLIQPRREAARPVAEMRECLQISKSTHSDGSGPRPASSKNSHSSYSSFFPLHQSLTTKEEGAALRWSTHPGWVPAHPEGQSRCAPLIHLIKIRSRIPVHLPLTHRSCSHSSTISNKCQL